MATLMRGGGLSAFALRVLRGRSCYHHGAWLADALAGPVSKDPQLT
jgi:hypothetical protein